MFILFQLKKAARLYNQDIKELEKYGEDLREHYEKSKVTHKKVTDRNHRYDLLKISLDRTRIK